MAHSARPLRFLTVAAALALLLSACATAPAETATPTSTPAAEASEPTTAPSEPAAELATPVSPALDFTATTLAGDSFDGASLAGKPAVLWFWAPWCPTCRAQIPEVTSLAKEYDGSIAFVGVGGLDSTDAIAGLAGDIPNITHLVDAEGTVWKHFGVTSQSTFEVISADGEIVSSGYLSDTDLADLVAGLAG